MKVDGIIWKVGVNKEVAGVSVALQHHTVEGLQRTRKGGESGPMGR